MARSEHCSCADNFTCGFCCRNAKPLIFTPNCDIWSVRRCTERERQRKMSNQVNARVYVGTYAKYNQGSLKGAWLNLNDYSDKNTFLEACRELHKDEDDPELMFQDHEGIPQGMVGESWISDEVWEWLGMDDDDRELLALYRENIYDKADLDTAKEAFRGTAESAAAWAEEFLEETGDLDKVPENLRNHIDFQSYADELDTEGWYFIQHNGKTWVFNPV